MRRGKMIAVVLALHMMVAAAASPMLTAAPQESAEQVGAGFGDLLTCAGCVVAGGIVLSTVGASGVLVTAVLGGAEAVGGAIALAICIDACYAAFAQ